jgi:TRAP transporter TAXI family solute receptor
VKQSPHLLKQIQTYVSDVFGLGSAAAISILLLALLVLSFSTYYFFHSAPANYLVLSSGPEGSMYHSNAVRLQKVMAKNGVTLTVLTSEGSDENLARLTNVHSGVDIAFIQSGTSRGTNVFRRAQDSSVDYGGLISLGALYVEPIQIYYNEPGNIPFISGFKGKRIAIGSEGSGTHLIATTLLNANGILNDGQTVLLPYENEEAVKALLNDQIDVAFLMGDTTSSKSLRAVRSGKNIRLFDFTQAEGYVRQNPFLHSIFLPQGVWDFGKNLPSNDIHLIGPSVDLVAKKTLHPALSDLLIESAQELYGAPSMYRKRGEFPQPLESDFKLSPNAADYYKSGKSFLYRIFPYWLASMLHRLLIGTVPIVIVLIPGLRLIPMFFKFRIELRIQRWYRAIMQLEQDMSREGAHLVKSSHLERLDGIEKAVHGLKIPASYAGQFYNLREHVNFVKAQLSKQ